MGSTGLNSLADAIRSGALLECTSLSFGDNGPLGNVPSLGNTMKSGGLKKLTYFSTGSDAFEPKDVVILVRSLMEHSPALLYMSLPKVGEDDRRFGTI